MKTFVCECEQRIFFRNSRCLSCQRELGFLPEHLVLSALEPRSDSNAFRALVTGATYRKCRNYVQQNVCNWMIAEGDEAELCRSCRLNRIIPDLGSVESRERWNRIELAKRQLLYTLFQLELPVVSWQQDPEAGLSFVFKVPTAEEPVLTGHANGVITLNLAEADSVAREEMRVKLKERYRTLLGHFRHEIGHYYWMRLIEHDPKRLDAFRALFGDEQRDYAQALKEHYERPAGGGWMDAFISDYASAHPWEDWAETWAHYLHMVDTFETAQHFGLVAGPPHFSLNERTAFEDVLKSWMELTIQLNALNRSMGLPDPYPFEIGEKPGEKLRFVHETVMANSRAHAPSASSSDGLDVHGHTEPVGAAAEHDAL